MREPHALRGHAIQVRRGDDFLTVATQVAPAQIIRHDPDQVRFGRSFRLASSQHGEAQGQEQKKRFFHGKWEACRLEQGVYFTNRTFLTPTSPSKAMKLS